MLPNANIPAVTIIALSEMDAQDSATRLEQEKIVQAREYHAGTQQTFLDDRAREYLNVDGNTEFSFNLCRPVVMAVAERMVVSGFSVVGVDSNDAAAKWAWDLWEANRMDAKQSDIHEDACTSGRHFVLVDWDSENNRPRFNPHNAYTSTTAGGDGAGIYVVYQDENPDALRYAVKVWNTQLDSGDLVTRANVYYPEKIEKWVRGGRYAEWTRYPAKGESWPIAFIGKDGLPIGVPVAVFRTPKERPEATSALPLQNALNKGLIDTLASADASAFRTLIALGFVPTTDGKPMAADLSNQLKINPNTIVSTAKSKTDADLKALEPVDVEKMLGAVEKFARFIAMATDTPLARFQITGQVSSADSQRENEAPLLAKIRNRQTVFGNAWEDAMNIARKLQNTFGEQQIPDGVFQTQWADAEVRNEKEHFETLAIKREKLQVPNRQIWKEAGYSPQEIEDMVNDPETKMREAIAQAGLNGLTENNQG